MPGVTPGQAGENLSGASTFNPRGASNFNALGQQANANGWLIDGIDNNEFTFNTVIVAPSVESVREFKVLNGVFSAEFGRGAGVVSVSTKSGSNEWHGTAFDFIRNDVFDAHNYFAQRRNADGSELPKPPLDRHQFGGAIGGPLIFPALQRHQPHVLLRRLLGPEGDARPVVRQHRADGADARRRLQRLPQPDDGRADPDLRSAHDAPESELQSRRTGERVQPAVPARPVPGQRHSAGSHSPGRPERREHLPGAQSAGELQQLPDHDQPRGDREPGDRPRRPPDERQRFVLRALDLREVQARRAAGAGGVLSADTAGGGGPIRSRAVRGRHPEHAPDDTRPGLQLHEGHRRGPRERTARRLRPHPPLHDPVRLRDAGGDVARHHGHQRQRHHDRPAEHERGRLHGSLRRSDLPAREPEADPLPGGRRPRADQGPAPVEVRLPLGGPHPVATDAHGYAQHAHVRPQLRQQPREQHRRHRPGDAAARLREHRAHVAS